MRRVLVFLGLVVLGFIALPSPAASAHPLGNFSVNRYAGLTFGPDLISAAVVVDVAELPTLQDPAPSCAETVATLVVSVGGEGLSWTVGASSLTLADGAGGLKTSRLECSLTAPARIDRSVPVTVANRFRDDRIGWRELTATGAGVRLDGSMLPSATVSDELRRYPDDLLSSPPDVRSASFTAVPDGSAAPAGVVGSERSSGGVPLGLSGPLAGAERWLDDVVGGSRLTPLVGLLAVLLALLLGAAHAALPGHGKTVMAAYLAGRAGRPRDAVAVGATVTLTHTGGVLALGLLLTTAAGVAGEAVLGWLGVASGVLVAGIGTGALLSALRRRARATTAGSAAQPGSGHAHASDHGHGHAQAVGHVHGPEHAHDHAHAATHADGHEQPQASGHEHTHDHDQAHASTHADGHEQPQASGHEHTHDHDQAHASTHADGHERPLASGHVHAHGHEHGSRRADASGHEHPHGHEHGSGHEDGPAGEERPGRGHGHGHGHSHGDLHGHGHGHGHSHGPGKWGIAGIGVAGGLVPSPSALVVLLGAIALGRTAFGILLVFAYGLGMAATLTAAGLVLIRVRDRFAGRFRLLARWQTAAPSATAALIVVVGLGLAGRALSTIA